jgi:thiosulfate/3-mercaptopyruvate sulfurtransferase
MQPPASPLVDVDWLAAHIQDPNVRVVDVRWYLGRRRGGAEAYERGHIPEAVYLDVDRDLAAPPGSGPGRHPLPDAKAFARTLAGLGVTPSSIVVAYDDAGGAIAARLWWLLRYFNHPGGRVLDGGIQAWTARGHALSTDDPFVLLSSEMELSPGGAGVVDKTEVNALRGDPRGALLLLDARARDRYEGIQEPIDARAGHIPGAKSAPFVENLVAPGGVLLPRADLERRYRELGALDAGKVIAYCGSGVTACHDLLALAHIGREDALLYEGSWSDWARDDDLPIATGPDP